MFVLHDCRRRRPADSAHPAGQCDVWRHIGIYLVIYACFVPYLGVCRLSGCDICRRCGMSSTSCGSRSVRAVHLRLFGDGLAVSVLLALSAVLFLGRCKAWRLVLSGGYRSTSAICRAFGCGGHALIVVAARARWLSGIGHFLGCSCSVEVWRISQRHGCGGGCFVCSWKKVSVCDGKKTTLYCCMSTLWCERGEIGKKC